jgi:hypothetical protein
MGAGGFLKVRLAAALGFGGALGALAGACGGAPGADGRRQAANVAAFGVTTTSNVIPPGQPVRGDGDADNPTDIDGNGDSDSAAVGGADQDNDSPTRASYDFPDADDRATFTYGHAPSAMDVRAIVRLVKRYYAAAAAGDGGRACALMLPAFAISVGQDFGRGNGPTYLGAGTNCPSVLELEFAHVRGELTEAVRVFSVRVHGIRAQAIVSSRRLRASSIDAVRQGGVWKIDALVGVPLP